MAERKRVQIVKIEVDDVLVDAKKCKMCGEVKPLYEFHRSKNHLGGKAPFCKKCAGVAAKKWYEENRDKTNRQRRKRIVVEKIKVNGVLVDAKKCTKCGEVKPLDEFYRDKKGIGGRLPRCKVCMRENIEKQREAYRKWYRRNKEKHAKAMRGWVEKNRARKYETEQRRRARKRGLPDNMTERRWEEILDDVFGGACALTGKTDDVHMEHFIPISTGHGGTYEGNVYPLDGSLNSSKRNKNPFEWIERPDIAALVPADRWNALIDYLAEKHGLTVDEYREFVYWCFDNPRTPEQAARDTKRGITSLDLWLEANGRKAKEEKELATV